MLPKLRHERGYLPHWDFGCGIQAITYRLADSLPAVAIERMRADLPLGPHGKPDEHAMRRRTEAWLDAGHGACLLRTPAVAEAVIQHWRHRDGSDYRMLGWVVMPNHVHICIALVEGRSLSTIVKAWKSCASRSIRSVVGGSGTVWQPDYWDRWIRDRQHLERTLRYIEMNPVSAGLVGVPEDWPWSSATWAGEGTR